MTRMKLRTTIYLTEEEDEALAILRERWGLSKNAEVIRRSIRTAARTYGPGRETIKADVPVHKGEDVVDESE